MSEKENFYTLEYGNSDGAIKFGSLESGVSKVSGEVISDVKLQGSYEGHYLTLDKDGPREGWTVARCPGSFNVTCGEYAQGPGSENSFMVIAKSGDIVIRAEDGDIRFEGRNVEIVASGSNNEKGTCNITANEEIKLNSKKVTIDAEVAWKFISSGVGQIVCRTSMQMYSGFTKCVSAGSANIPSKYGGKDTKTIVDEAFQ